LIGSAAGFERLDELRHHLVEIADDPEALKASVTQASIGLG
jgi:hypothetical protein